MKKTLRALLAATVRISAAHAGTFNVTRTDDPIPDGCKVNDCSLREAVIDADQTAAACATPARWSPTRSSEMVSSPDKPIPDSPPRPVDKLLVAFQAVGMILPSDFGQKKQRLFLNVRLGRQYEK